MIIKIRNKNLSRRNTFRMKVKAALYLSYGRPGDLLRIDWDSLPQPVLQMGSGSNLLFTGDFPGTVMHSRIKGIEMVSAAGDEVMVRAGGGVVFDDLCGWAATKGLWGIENLSAIPGTVGASAVQNVGAYGVEAGDVIVSVECFDIRKREFVLLSHDECGFAYRDSYFKHNRGRYVVTAVTFRLRSDFAPQLEYGHLREQVERNLELVQPPADPYNPVQGPLQSANPLMLLTPSLVRDTVRAIREEKLPNPDKVGSAGSFFKNPVVSAEVFANVVTVAKDRGGDGVSVPHYDLDGGMVKIPAAWLIDFCGLKDCSIGGAAVWKNQPLVIVNASGKALPEDVLALEKKIIDRVQRTFGIVLSPEVDHI